MKKITYLLSFTILCSFASHAQFPESFDGGVIPSTWAIFAGDGESPTNQSWMGNTFTSGVGLAMCLDENAGFETQDWLVSPLTSIGNTNSMLNFNEQTAYTAPYEPSAMSVRVSTTSQTDISTFTTLSSLSATEIFNGTYSRSVDLSAYEGQDIYIAWVLTQTWGDGWLIYNLTLENQNASIPSPATTPNPADEATVDLTNDTDMNNDGSITAADQHYVFTWSPGVTGDAPSAYDYYFGSSSSALSLLGETSANDGFTLYGLSTGTTYFWQVVPKNAGGSAVAASCPIWSFTTSSNVLSFNDNQLNSIVVSPNPVKDVVTINNLSGLDSVEVFNQLGQLVLKSNADLLNDNRLDLSTLNPGMYMLKIKAENKSKTVKIIKE